jgi:uncharacterized protein with ParB-like and HNH nuclease domain
MDAVLRRIKSGSINLSPNFQRNSVWDKKRKSLLIRDNNDIRMFKENIDAWLQYISQGTVLGYEIKRDQNTS